MVVTSTRSTICGVHYRPQARLLFSNWKEMVRPWRLRLTHWSPSGAKTYNVTGPLRP